MPLGEMILHWKDYRKSGQVGDELHPHDVKWAMSIDLDICTGCSACVTACYAENNLAVVGKERFARGLAMHWLRIEHYWNEGDESATQPRFPEQGAQHMPMMCQQCEHAPCEPVCPVAATYHTPDGLNAQIYNRCVGSRYCSNNCPYKVRYFNFFAYQQDLPAPMEMQFNPDLTVRDKGVMEKCTFCVQRTRRAMNDARNEGREVRDGDVQTACQQACPTQAIVFGNLSDPASRVAQSWRTHKMALGEVERPGHEKDERGYRVFDQLNTEPSVSYLERVRDDAI